MRVPQRMWSEDSIWELILSYLDEAESLDSAALHTPVSASLFSKGVLGLQVYTTTLHGFYRFWIKIRSVGLHYKHFYLFSHFTSPCISLMIGVLLISSYTYWPCVFRNICSNILSIFKSNYLGFLLLMLYGQDLIMYLILCWNMSINRVGSIVTRKINNCAKDFP